MIKWVFNDFRLKHLIWIKFIFFFQSASMTVLYPFLNLHMKSLGLSIQEVAIINAVIPVSLSEIDRKNCCTLDSSNFCHHRILILDLIFIGIVYIYPTVNWIPCKAMLQFPCYVVCFNCSWRIPSIGAASYTSRSRYNALSKNS